MRCGGSYEYYELVADRPHLRVDLAVHLAAPALLVACHGPHPLHGRLPVREGLVLEERFEAGLRQGCDRHLLLGVPDPHQAAWRASKRSGCSRRASSSTPSTSRGPGREKYEAASTEKTSRAPSSPSSLPYVRASRAAR